MRQDQLESEGMVEALNTQLKRMEEERAQFLEEKAEREEREKKLDVEVAKCHKFMLQISEESFRQGIRQVAFFHGVAADDRCYDSSNDVVNDKLMPLGGGTDEVMVDNEVEGKVSQAGSVESEPSFEVIIDS